MPRQLSKIALYPCSTHVGTEASGPTTRLGAEMAITRRLPACICPTTLRGARDRDIDVLAEHGGHGLVRIDERHHLRQLRLHLPAAFSTLAIAM